MSWSVSATGPASDVAKQVEKQIASVKLSDAGEMETVALVGGLLAQTLATFDPSKPVSVVANGSMGFKDWGTKAGPYQQYNIAVSPIHFSA